VFPDAASATERARAIYALADGALRAAITQEAQALDRELHTVLRAHLQGDGATLASLLAGAPQSMSRGICGARSTPRGARQREPTAPRSRSPCSRSRS
jgi:hypothetical protein